MSSSIHGAEFHPRCRPPRRPTRHPASHLRVHGSRVVVVTRRRSTSSFFRPARECLRNEYAASTRPGVHPRAIRLPHTLHDQSSSAERLRSPFHLHGRTLPALDQRQTVRRPVRDGAQGRPAQYRPPAIRRCLVGKAWPGARRLQLEHFDRDRDRGAKTAGYACSTCRDWLSSQATQFLKHFFRR